MKVLAVVTAKGGAGKSTLSQVLSVALDGVVLVDMDPQLDSAEWAETRRESFPDLPSVAFAQATTAAEIERIAKKAADDGKAVLIVDTPPIHEKTSRQYLAELRKLYRIADAALVPLHPSPKDLRAARDTIADLRDAGCPTAVVLSVASARASINDEAREALAADGVEICPETIIRRMVYVRAAIDGRTPLDVEPKGKAAEEIRAVADYVRAKFIEG